MKIYGVFFSPTHATRRIVETLAQTMKTEFNVEKLTMFDLTLPNGRLGNAPNFGPDDVLLLGVPVYGGRVPKLARPLVAELKGGGAKAVIVAVYGNRAFEDALLEMKDTLSANGFAVVAAGAFIGEHSMSRRLAAGRPDDEDMAQVRDFAAKAATRVKVSQNAKNGHSVQVPGDFPYRADNAPMPFAPVTNEVCYCCMQCALYCPAGVISIDDPKAVEANGCIHCCACIKGCPVEAKRFDVPPLLEKIQQLEENFMARKDPEIFL